MEYKYTPPGLPNVPPGASFSGQVQRELNPAYTDEVKYVPGAPNVPVVVLQNGVQQSGFPQNGLPQNAFPQNGFPQNGFLPNGSAQNAIAQNGFPHNELPQNGFPQNAVVKQEFNPAWPTQLNFPQPGFPLMQGVPFNGMVQNEFIPGPSIATDPNIFSVLTPEQRAAADFKYEILFHRWLPQVPIFSVQPNLHACHNMFTTFIPAIFNPFSNDLQHLILYSFFNYAPIDARPSYSQLGRELFETYRGRLDPSFFNQRHNHFNLCFVTNAIDGDGRPTYEETWFPRELFRWFGETVKIISDAYWQREKVFISGITTENLRKFLLLIMEVEVDYEMTFQDMYTCFCIFKGVDKMSPFFERQLITQISHWVLDERFILAVLLRLPHEHRAELLANMTPEDAHRALTMCSDKVLDLHVHTKLEEIAALLTKASVLHR